MIPTLTPFQIIEQSKDIVRQVIQQSNWVNIGTPEVSHAACSTLIGRYTAAVAAEFQAYLGVTYAFVRHEDAQHALKDNIRCEMGNDHIGMLHRFAVGSNATPRVEDREWVEPALQNLREVFERISKVGLAGLTVLAVLENTSEIFIPILRNAAAYNGCDDFEYTQVHGKADVEHSVAFLKAMEKEQHEGYEDPQGTMVRAAHHATQLVIRIFADLED